MAKEKFERSKPHVWQKKNLKEVSHTSMLARLVTLIMVRQR